MKCPNCKQAGAVIRYAGKVYGTGDTLLVIENVPAISCPHCGSVTYTAATVKVLDTIKRERQQWATKRDVAVALFPTGAGAVAKSGPIKAGLERS